jgi:hypothetical protein
MRRTVIPILIFAGFCLNAADEPQSPPWLHDPTAFCRELSKRTNGAASPVPYGKPQRSAFGTILRAQLEPHARLMALSANTTGQIEKLSPNL